MSDFSKNDYLEPQKEDENEKKKEEEIARLPTEDLTAEIEKLNEHLDGNSNQRAFPETPEANKDSKKHMIDSLFKGATGELSISFRPTEPISKEKVESLMPKPPTTKDSKKHHVDGLFCGDTGVIPTSKEHTPSPPPYSPPPPSLPDGESILENSDLEEGLLIPEEEFKPAPPMDPSSTPVPVASSMDPLSKTPPSILDGDTENHVFVDDLAQSLDKLDTKLRGKDFGLPWKQIGLFLFLICLIGGIAWLAYKFWGGNQKKVFLSKWEEKLEKEDPSQILMAYNVLLPYLSPEEKKKIQKRTFLALLEKVKAKRKNKKIQEGMEILDIINQNFKTSFSSEIQGELENWKNLLEELIEKKNFDPAYLLIKNLRSYLEEEDWKKTSFQLHQSYLDYLYHKKDPFALLQGLDRIPKESFYLLEKKILEKIREFKNFYPPSGTSLLIRFHQQHPLPS
ncbi:MAG: hypothetical protein D6785_08825, partial [Planctomycetota bacterium]